MPKGVRLKPEQIVAKLREIERSGSVDLNRYTPIDKCPWGGLKLVQSCPTAAVVVDG